MDERQWLLATAYNTGTECLQFVVTSFFTVRFGIDVFSSASVLDEAKRWFEASTIICRFVPEGKQRAEKVRIVCLVHLLPESDLEVMLMFILPFYLAPYIRSRKPIPNSSLGMLLNHEGGSPWPICDSGLTLIPIWTVFTLGCIVSALYSTFSANHVLLISCAFI